MYRALIEIGGYKKGEIVPDEKAVIWLKMYSEPPVERISDSPAAPIAPKEDPKQPTQDSELMVDDYLNRGVNVVKKNLEKDALDKKTLQDLLKSEKAGKNRNVVIEAIKIKLGAR